MDTEDARKVAEATETKSLAQYYFSPFRENYRALITTALKRPIGYFDGENVIHKVAERIGKFYIDMRS